MSERRRNQRNRNVNSDDRRRDRHYQDPNQPGPYGQQNPYGQRGAYRQDAYNRYNQGAPHGQRGQYDDYDEYPNEKYKKSKKRKNKRRVIFAVEIIVLLVLAVGLFAMAKLSKIQRKEIPKGDILVNDSLSPEEVEVLSGYTNIALYGVDSREGNLEVDAHSDALMIASINNKTKDIKLVSVYRDTYLDNTNGEYRKATECYYFGGPSRSMNMLNVNLDLNITDFVTVDFGVVAEVVDELGGIEIDVQENEIIHLNNYQVEGSEVTGKEIQQVTSSGIQTLNGLQTLSYCRIRYTEGSDYKRTERQRTVLEKILEKAKSTSLLTLNSIIDKVAPKMLTSLSTPEVLGLAKDIGSYDLVETKGFPFTLQAANISAGDCVIPVNLANNVLELHQWLFGSDGYTPSAKVQEISDKIINETGIQ